MNTRAMETQNVQTDALTRTTPVYCRVPAADIYETGDAYVLMLDLPGARKGRFLSRLRRANSA